MTDSDNLLHLREASADCERFMTLVERIWVDEQPVTGEDLVFVTTHKKACLECAKFDAVISAFEDMTDEEGGEGADVRIRKVVDRKFSKSRRYVFAAGIAAVLALGLAVVIAAALSGREPAATTPENFFSLAKGSIILAGNSVRVGEQFSFGEKPAKIPMDTLVEIPAKLYVAVERDSKIDRVSQSGDDIRISLGQGRIAVHLVPNSHIRLLVETRDGLVEVKGTIFVVEASKDSESVSVVRGRVLVHRKNRDAKKGELLAAGWTYSFNEEKSSPRMKREQDSLLEMLGVQDSTEDSPTVESDTESTLSEAPGDTESHKSEGRLGPAERPTPEALLQAASECRAAGNWKCAVDNYGRLVEHYPSLPDAATAMIPAAQIFLEKLGRPNEALRYFRRYQKKRPEGGLGQEALFGECRALQILGRAAEEKDCLSRYLEKYPNTLYSQMAKSRLMRIMVKE